jgi:hypothetical protein
MDTHTEFTAARIACAPGTDEWRREFVPLYSAIERVVSDRRRALDLENAARRLQRHFSRTG